MESLPKKPRLDFQKVATTSTEDYTKDDVNSQDEEYFKSYSDVGIHEEMLSDVIRTNAYRCAILKNYEKIRGKIVADIGAGTGVLSIFCVQAGAKKVYAVEASELARQTRLIVNENKMSSRIEVLQEKAENIDISEKLDVIVSEWMGYSLLYESMLQSVINTRDRLLKPDGFMFPASATLYLAPFSDDAYQERLEIWNDVKSLYKVSMETMKKFAQKCISETVHVKCLPVEAVQAHCCQVCKLNLKSVTVKDINNIYTNFDFQCFGHSVIHGFVTWFSVGFPGEVTLSTSPYHEETHWGQTLFYVEKPFTVEQDTSLKGSFSMSPNKVKSRFLDININYQLNSDPPVHKYYYMNDCIT